MEKMRTVAYVLIITILLVGFGWLADKASKDNWNGNVCKKCHTENAFEYACSDRGSDIYKCKNCGYIIHIYFNTIEELN